ncbi:unnamed protein product [Ectocarpus sp. 4 AP-2014]
MHDVNLCKSTGCSSWVNLAPRSSRNGGGPPKFPTPTSLSVLCKRRPACLSTVLD